ncbi:serine/threonine-protein kinase MAK-like isoform X2 [Corticium candelabrum]|uniref:serine/threonine-protein kinase MAK-like isoform X2 n=1 Tax=Corticium candelabrum TaxID=121492 RepID=UPI002E264918|nr:serine/threonine-protein kinase MAK-like isoform X2 [Corticium candelabrum]
MTQVPPYGRAQRPRVTLVCLLHEQAGMNKYVVKQVIGEGAYGVVMKCRHKLNNEWVAIKKFKDAEDDSEARRAITRELSMLQKIKHKNIVSLRETFRRKGKLYMVFDFVEKNFLQLLEEHPNGIEISLVRSYTYQLIAAIHWCHKNDVIHRDVKPENLLISSDNVVKLCDFGFARSIMSSSAPYTDYVATRWYRAPELLLGGSYGPAIDIWSIGCIMGELTDGKPVFPGESEIDQLYVIQKVLGPLPDDLMNLFSTSPRFSGLKFPPVQQPSKSLDDRYSSRLDTEMLDILKSVLTMSASQRPTASDCQEHAAFTNVCSVEKRETEPVERLDEKAQSVVDTRGQQDLSTTAENSELLRRLSDSKNGSKKPVGIIESVANSITNANEEHTSEHICRSGQSQEPTEQGRGTEVSNPGEDVHPDVKAMRSRWATADADRVMDETTGSRAPAAAPLKKLKGKKSAQSTDMMCPVMDFNQSIPDSLSARSDRRVLDHDNGTTMSSLLAQPRKGTTHLTSLHDGTEEPGATTVVAGREAETVQCLLPMPRGKYGQAKSPSLALRGGHNLLMKNQSASLLTTELGPNRTATHAISSLIQTRGSDSIFQNNPLPVVITESESAIRDPVRQRMSMGHSYSRAPVTSTSGLLRDYKTAGINLNQSYPPPQLNHERRRRHRVKAHSARKAEEPSLGTKTSMTRRPSDLQHPSLLPSNPCDNKLLNTQDLMSVTVCRIPPLLAAANGHSPVLPCRPILKHIDSKHQDNEQRQEFVLPETVFDNPGEKIRLKPLKLPSSANTGKTRRMPLEQIHCRAPAKSRDDGGLPPNVSGQPDDS